MNRSRGGSVWIDLAAIAFLSFMAQATHFSYQQGRAIISGDSVQYTASAEALLTPGKTPHFEMRKPGYTLFLAGVALALGRMGYTVVTCQHVLLGLLPLAAYGLGKHLHGRTLGWLAAILTMARLQEVFRANRIMSEVLFIFLLTFGVLVFAVGLRRLARGRWMLPAGILLGMAWLTRGTATPLIAVLLVVLCLATRHDWRRAIVAVGSFSIPIVLCVLLECSLNAAYAGQFRPSNGTAGATLLLRARNFEGFDWPHSLEAQRVAALIPQRDPQDAYIANLLDAWAARYHAIHNLGLDEWEYDRMMGRVGLQSLAANTGPYLESSVRLTLAHLLRRPDGQSLSPIEKHRLAEPLVHPSAPSLAEGREDWFAYYGLPHVTPEESIAQVERTQTAAAQRAPFGDSRVWRFFRYGKTKPVAEWTLAVLTWLGTLWPGFALLACRWLGLNRQTCVFLATAYLADALFIGFLTPTTARLQFPWLVIDTVLAGALAVGVLNKLRITNYELQITKGAPAGVRWPCRNL